MYVCINHFKIQFLKVYQQKLKKRRENGLVLTIKTYFSCVMLSMLKTILLVLILLYIITLLSLTFKDKTFLFFVYYLIWFIFKTMIL